MKHKRNGLIAAILGGTLLTGVGIGSMTTLLLLKPVVEDLPPPPPDLGTVEMRKPPIADVMLRRMDRVLNLSEMQREAIGAELQLTSEAFESLHRVTREQMEQIMDRTNSALKSHLTPEQIVLFDDNFAKPRFGGKIHRMEGANWKDRDGPGKRFRQGDDARWGRPGEHGRDNNDSDSPQPEQPPLDPDA